MQKKHYYPYFDWLRGLLAIVVMLGHEGAIGWHLSGNFAVQVFFALSGWLIGGILIKLTPAELPHFYFNRAMRIWIPYYLALILLICTSLMREPITTKWLEFIFYKLSFVYNIFGPPQLANYMQAMPLSGTGNHFWSVNAEEQFYLLAPLILVLVRHALARNSIVWLVIAGFAWFTNTYASIVLGVFAAVAVNQYGNFHENKRAKITFILILLISTLGFCQDLYYKQIAPFAAISIVMLLAQKGRKSQIGTIVGGMSYPLYLNHWIGFFIAHTVLKPFGLRDSFYSHIISFIVNISIAVMLYWLIDRRILAARSSIFTQKRGLIATAIAYSMVIFGIIVGLIFFDA